ncbi:hypothetical protein PO148_08305 [Limosilactobacillus mucosae]|uniref:Uncharacterized protein n=1 Tax=Limosilactobacillus mucosae TaxID=97478 RepID=A0AAJ1HW27_LIMMU|nr:hypothetical protein [Limosilactobacillus mucosae]MDC2830391.1 hypothetical protein [Limosilactobacillus mucosae]MDC2837965.1 hypothetical protein [Limosilactobacillus mucosae]MDC2849978.1 hypothetical protein [Limosilactobacillus mucosae]MDC2854118.1 hypothetical protein [Limosilactobacillus mucosae]
MSDTIVVYEFDAKDRTNHYLDAVQVSADSKLQDNQTTVAPNGSQFFNGKEWVDELVSAYHYDDNGYFDYFSSVPEGSELEPNETLVVPHDANGAGMYKPKFDATQNKWVETLTKEEIDALNKPVPAKPTAEQQTISLLGQRVAQATADNAQLKQDNTQLKQMVSMLGQTVAQLKAQSTN